jgi:hypothetical protein
VRGETVTDQHKNKKSTAKGGVYKETNITRKKKKNANLQKSLLPKKNLVPPVHDVDRFGASDGAVDVGLADLSWIHIHETRHLVRKEETKKETEEAKDVSGSACHSPSL